MDKIIYFRPKKHKDRIKKRIFVNILRFLFLFFLMFIIGYEAYYLVINTGYFEITKIVVSGNKNVKSETIIKIANVYPGMKLYNVDKKKIINRIKVIVAIKDVEVSYNAFGELNIKVVERMPVAIVVSDGKFYEIDSEGVILAKELTKVSNIYPIISGIKVSNDLRIGDRLPMDKIKIAIDWIKMFPHNFLTHVSEINLEDDPYIFTIEGTKIYPGDIKRFLKIYPLVKKKIDSLNIEQKKIAHIDMRYKNEIIYKIER